MALEGDRCNVSCKRVEKVGRVWSTDSPLTNWIGWSWSIIRTSLGGSPGIPALSLCLDGPSMSRVDCGADEEDVLLDGALASAKKNLSYSTYSILFLT